MGGGRYGIGRVVSDKVIRVSVGQESVYSS